MGSTEIDAYWATMSLVQEDGTVLPSLAPEQSCSSSSSQNQPKGAELRRDPADGKERTLQATYKAYEDQFTRREIDDYWTRMELVQTKTSSMGLASSDATEKNEAIP